MWTLPGLQVLFRRVRAMEPCLRPGTSQYSFGLLTPLYTPAFRAAYRTLFLFHGFHLKLRRPEAGRKTRSVEGQQQLEGAQIYILQGKRVQATCESISDDVSGYDYRAAHLLFTGSLQS
jgi:hypothetical protein